MAKTGTIISACVLIAISIVLAFQVHRIKSLKSEIEKARNEISIANARIDSLSDTIERSTLATNALFKALNDSAQRYAEKIETVEASGDACDWLDDVLPDSVRSLYGCTGKNESSAKGYDGALLKEGARKDGH